MLVKTLMWPVISLLLIGGTHFILEALLPALQTIFTPPVIAPIVLSVGIWLGYRAVQNGGNLGHVILAGAIVGILPLVLETVGFGMILGFGNPARFLVGVFGFSMVLFGSLIGGGFALSKGKAGI
jgi:hypothetical protein